MPFKIILSRAGFWELDSGQFGGAVLKIKIQDLEQNKPFQDCFWIVPGSLLASEYPRNIDENSSRKKIRAILVSGVRCFANLTEMNEIARGAPLLEYESLLRELGVPATVTRFPIPDKGTIPGNSIKIILDFIDQKLSDGIPVYLHCWGGHGRTGMVAGCWLARHGLASGHDVLSLLRSLRSSMPDSWKSSPETPEQTRIVLTWGKGD